MNGGELEVAKRNSALEEPSAPVADKEVAESIDTPRSHAHRIEVDKTGPEAFWRQRLLDIWELVGIRVGAGSSDERDRYVDEMLASVDPSSLPSPVGGGEAGQSWESAPGAIPFSGSAPESVLWVRANLDELSSARDVLQFLLGPAARVVDDLERRDEGTRENRVDLLVSVLNVLRGLSPTEAVALSLGGYLWRQDEFDGGLILSMESLAQIAISVGSQEGFECAMALSHLALIRARQFLARSPADVDEGLRQVVTTATSNIATSSTRLLEGDGDARAAGLAVLRELKVISGSFAETLRDPFGIAGEVADLLKLEHRESPIEELTVVSDMGALVSVWGLSPFATALLAAQGAVARSLGEMHSHSPARFFNAGLGLARLAEYPDPPELVRAELALYALGIVWSATVSTTLDEFLNENDGLDCAVNFVATIVQDARRDRPHEEQAIRDLVGLLGQLTEARGGDDRLLVDARRIVDLQRIRNSISRLRELWAMDPVPLGGVPTLVELRAAATTATESLVGRDSGDVSPRHHPQLLLWTADRVRQLFLPLLAGRESELEALVSATREVISSRADPATVLGDRYALFLVPPEFGTLPAVSAGAIPERRWTELVDRLHMAPESASSALQPLASLDLR